MQDVLDLRLFFGTWVSWYNRPHKDRLVIVGELSGLLNLESPPQLHNVSFAISLLVEHASYLPTLKRLVRVVLEQNPKLLKAKKPSEKILRMDMHHKKPILLQRCLLASIPVPKKYFNWYTFLTWKNGPSPKFVDALKAFRNRLERYLTLWTIRHTCPRMPLDLRILLVEYVEQAN